MRELTDRQIRSLLAAHASEATIPEIARRFGVSGVRVAALWAEAGLGKRTPVRLSPEPVKITEKKRPTRRQRLAFGEAKR